jgi:hypothetical protein
MMKEIIEFRIFDDYYHLLSKPNNAVFNGAVYVIKVEKGDRTFEEIRQLSSDVKQKYNKHFFGYSNIKRKYGKKEIDTATLFQIKIKTTFEPAGEECGTIYDETIACEICGANRKQIGSLKLKKGTIPKKDIARTIAGEIVVSERFKKAFELRNLKGLELLPVEFAKGKSDYYQIIALNELELTINTVAGGDIFDIGAEGSEAYEFTVSGGHKVKFEREVYKCPKGHTIGLNLLSEAYVSSSPSINDYDFFSSKQKIGVKRGLLRPEPLYLCSPTFRKVVEEEKLSGFEFEIAHIQ